MEYVVSGFCESINYFKPTYDVHLKKTNKKKHCNWREIDIDIFYIVLERGQASQMPRLVFVTPSLWLCLAICLKLPVETLYMSCWGTVYSHLHPKCLSSPSESPLISPSPVLFDLPIIWVSTA